MTDVDGPPPTDTETPAPLDHDHAWSRVKHSHDVESDYRDALALVYRCDVCGLTWSLD